MQRVKYKAKMPTLHGCEITGEFVVPDKTPVSQIARCVDYDVLNAMDITIVATHEESEEEQPVRSL